MPKPFQGFRVPEQNWFKLPNEWTDITYSITSLVELKVIEYVLRHTWGFSEYGQLKRITYDEFQNGRKRKDGSRIDKGTGLGRSSIIEGLKRALNDGFLVVEVDDSDRGRIKKRYGLNLKNENRGTKSIPQSSESNDRNLNARGKNFVPRVPKTIPRTGKDTLKKDTCKINSLSGLESPDLSTNSEPSERKKPEPTAWDYRAVDELNKVISSHVKVNRRMRPKAWAEQFRLLREYDGVPKDAIKAMIHWYARHIGGKYDVQAFSASSFRDKWEKLVAAKMRAGTGTSGKTGKRYDLDDPEQADEWERLIDRVELYMRERGTMPEKPDVPDQEDVDEALRHFGEEPGVVGWNDFL